MTLRINADLSKWLYVPTEWPWAGCSDADEWSEWVATEVEADFAHDDSKTEWLIYALRQVSKGLESAEYRFAYFVQPTEIFSYIRLFEIPTQPQSNDSLLGLNDPDCLRPPTSVQFNSGLLGQGEKSLRFVSNDQEGTITGIALWVWRLQDRDIVMIVSDSNLANFQVLQDEFDEFAKNISLEDHEFHFKFAKE